jgi:hypothetical protein
MQLVNFGLNNVLGAPVGMPTFGVPQTNFVNPAQNKIPPPQMPSEGLKRAVAYLADYGGCGYYRCIAPHLMLNLYEKAVIIESTMMVLEPHFYREVESVKLQRQATPAQKHFVKHLRDIMDKKGGRLIYEIDDVVLAEDIPLYNRNRDAFTDPSIRQSIIEIIQMMDEVTVTCDYFRDYLIAKTGNKNVTTVPNYLMKWWFDRYYNLGDLVKKFEKNKKKPVIAIFASGTHCDVLNRVNQKDDFEFVLPYIIKTRKEFEWKFYGSFPLGIQPYIKSGDVKFCNWAPLPNFPQTVAESGAQLTFAALQDNEFNRCKSNIKLIEAGAVGLPCVCPDMVTYKDAILKYKNGSEFIDCIKAATKNQTVYADLCKRSRAYAENFWLDDEKNLMKHHEVFFTPHKSPKRKFLT